MVIDYTKEMTKNVFEALQSRYTCREFKSVPIPQKTIETMLEAANRTPSTANTQPWEVYVASGSILNRLRERFREHAERKVAPNPFFPFPQEWPPDLDQRRKEVQILQMERAGVHPGDTTEEPAHRARQHGFFNAPAVVYLCMDQDLGPWSVFDLGAFSQSLMLAAQNLDVDTAPALMLVDYPDAIREELRIPQNLAIVIGIAMGYGTERSRPGKWPSPRRRLYQFTKWFGF